MMETTQKERVYFIVKAGDKILGYLTPEELETIQKEVSRNWFYKFVRVLRFLLSPFLKKGGNDPEMEDEIQAYLQVIPTKKPLSLEMTHGVMPVQLHNIYY
ncbi:hypothetical protein [Escherichia coli]|jgi:hypothetical protein|uniref:hypothetical protein n=1 Tax=Escherichia coli TaxID=562 RepID=UPI0012FF843D|nr:hypothetical protein [Escherichia coli]EEQ0113566.1 hypothetical protein [Salmonella enterica]HCD7580355.1 hypothetical protein [Escherichia coli]HCM7782905.1 hypothetical protein [Klebsiella pneumoniae]HCS7297246.1 hypothetical protein [Escherichia coli]